MKLALHFQVLKSNLFVFTIVWRFYRIFLDFVNSFTFFLEMVDDFNSNEMQTYVDRNYTYYSKSFWQFLVVLYDFENVVYGQHWQTNQVDYLECQESVELFYLLVFVGSHQVNCPGDYQKNKCEIVDLRRKKEEEWS